VPFQPYLALCGNRLTLLTLSLAPQLCSMFGSAVAFDGSFLDLFPSFVHKRSLDLLFHAGLASLMVPSSSFVEQLLGSLMGLCQVKLVVLNPIMTSGFEVSALNFLYLLFFGEPQVD
jgi:hypothetical protein